MITLAAEEFRLDALPAFAFTCPRRTADLACLESAGRFTTPSQRSVLLSDPGCGVFRGDGRATGSVPSEATFSFEVREAVRLNLWVRVRGSKGGFAGFYLKHDGADGSRTLACAWAGHDRDEDSVAMTADLEPGLYSVKLSAAGGPASWAVDLALQAL